MALRKKRDIKAEMRAALARLAEAEERAADLSLCRRCQRHDTLNVEAAEATVLMLVRTPESRALLG